MADKPKRFSQKEIRREPISPEELDSWVRYVKEEQYEAVKKADSKIVKEDIRISVHFNYFKIDFMDIHGDIAVETVIPGDCHACYVIALFASRDDAEETFKNYATSKNARITERENVLSVGRVISV